MLSEDGVGEKEAIAWENFGQGARTLLQGKDDLRSTVRRV